MKINETVKEVYETAKSKGWHETPNPIPEVLMKMVTELSEAMEEYRNNRPACYVINHEGKPAEITCISPESFRMIDGDTVTPIKPEGILIELADCVIRIMDTCGEMGWDLEGAIRVKMEYNKTRSYKHGGKVC